MTNLLLKREMLEKILQDLQSVLVAYSGGTDSTFLLKVAADVLGDRVTAVTAHSEIYTRRELEEARQTADTMGVRHIVVHTDELDDPHFSSNPPGRCYYCKKELFAKLFDFARRNNLHYVIDGSNCDDERDFRPGMRASEEFGVRSPLRDAGFTKEEIRTLSKDMHLLTWDKSPLPCLATRFPYGTHITRDKIMRVASAEQFLADLGIRQLRVRDHDTIARIEVPRGNMPIFLDTKISHHIMEKFKALGYTYVALDIQGYRMGSMNEPLKQGGQEWTERNSEKFWKT